MPKFKNIRIKKRGGGSRLQRVQVLASGKYKFVKNIKSKSKTKTKSSSKTRRTTRRKSNRKTGGNRKTGKRKMTIPIALIAGVAAGVRIPIQQAMAGDIPGALGSLQWNYTGIGNDGVFHIEGLAQGLVPLLAGALVHKFVGGEPLNVNRALAAAGVPFLRI